MMVLWVTHRPAENTLKNVSHDSLPRPTESMSEKFIHSPSFLSYRFQRLMICSFTNATDTALLRVVMAAVEGEPFSSFLHKLAYNIKISRVSVTYFFNYSSSLPFFICTYFPVPFSFLLPSFPQHYSSKQSPRCSANLIFFSFLPLLIFYMVIRYFINSIGVYDYWQFIFLRSIQTAPLSPTM